MQILLKKLTSLPLGTSLSLAVALILLITIGITINEALSRQNQVSQASSSRLYIYNNSLSHDWTVKNLLPGQDSLVLNNTAFGQQAITFTPATPKGQLDFISNSPLDVAKYSTLYISALMNAPGQAYSIRLLNQYQEPMGTEVSLKNGDEYMPTQVWKEYKFSLLDFHSPSTIIGGISIIGNPSSIRQPLYINQIAFVSTAIVRAQSTLGESTSFQVSPTLYCLGSCPTDLPTTQPPQDQMPTITTQQPINETSPTIDPCINTTEQTAEATHRKEKDKKPDFSGNIFQRLLQLLQQFFQLLQQLLGLAPGAPIQAPIEQQPVPTTAPIDEPITAPCDPTITQSTPTPISTAPTTPPIAQTPTPTPIDSPTTDSCRVATFHASSSKQQNNLATSKR
jgi:hypothetical protein